MSRPRRRGRPAAVRGVARAGRRRELGCGATYSQARVPSSCAPRTVAASGVAACVVRPRRAGSRLGPTGLRSTCSIVNRSTPWPRHGRGCRQRSEASAHRSRAALGSRSGMLDSEADPRVGAPRRTLAVDAAAIARWFTHCRPCAMRRPGRITVGTVSGTADEMIAPHVGAASSALELLARRFHVVALLEIGDIAAADAEMLASEREPRNCAILSTSGTCRCGARHTR